MAEVCGEFAPRLVQWIRQGDLDCPELDGDKFFSDRHVVPACDVFSLLAEDEYEDRGGPVTCFESVFVDDSFERFVLSRLGKSRAGAAAVRNDGETGWDGFGLDGPFEEPRRVMGPSACRTSR